MYNGVLLLDKPRGFTSHDAVAKARGIFGQRRIGHAGTLDPLAEGLLVVLLGSATRLCDYASGADKEYVARLRLGTTTDTEDVTGTVLAQRPGAVTAAELETALAAFRGEIEQKPPMYSAVQIGGQRLYKLARRGVEVERPSRAITVAALEALPRTPALAPEEWELRVVCSKGTYIRTLCADIGAALGCGGCMAALRRTRAGVFALDRAHTFAALEAVKPDLAPFVLPCDAVFPELPALTVSAAGAVRARNGAFLTAEHLAAGAVPPEGGLCRVYDGRSFVWLGESRALDRGGLAVFCRASFFEA